MKKPSRESLLRRAGFTLEGKIWRHTDGRALGESTMQAITIEALKRYLFQ